MSIIQIITDDGVTKSYTVSAETADMVRAVIVLTRATEQSKKSS